MISKKILFFSVWPLRKRHKAAVIFGCLTVIFAFCDRRPPPADIEFSPRYNDIPLKYYDIADEYATEAAEPVAESERDALAHYFQLLLTRLSNNEEISEEAQQEMATEAGIRAGRIDDIANFLNQWGNE